MSNMDGEALVVSASCPLFGMRSYAGSLLNYIGGAQYSILLK